MTFRNPPDFWLGVLMGINATWFIQSYLDNGPWLVKAVSLFAVMALLADYYTR